MCVRMPVCAYFGTQSKSREGKEIWRAAESASDRETRQKDGGRRGGGGRTEGRRWRGRVVTDNIVVLGLPQGQTRQSERKKGNET